jgi:hypothetical protein
MSVKRVKIYICIHAYLHLNHYIQIIIHEYLDLCTLKIVRTEYICTQIWEHCTRSMYVERTSSKGWGEEKQKNQDGHIFVSMIVSVCTVFMFTTC